MNYNLQMSFCLCSSCRKEIDFGQIYQACSVSTCNRKRNPMFFCSVSCWEAHLPGARHREAWAIEKKAPSKEGHQQELKSNKTLSYSNNTSTTMPARRTISVNTSESGDELPLDVLVVVSKIKKYIKAKANMNTSDGVMPLLSDELRKICDHAIHVAKQNGRVTILDRDMKEALKTLNQ